MKKPLHRETYLITVTRPENVTIKELRDYIRHAVYAFEDKPCSPLHEATGPVKVRKQQDDPRVARGNALKALREAKKIQEQGDQENASGLAFIAACVFLQAIGEKEIVSLLKDIGDYYG